MGSMFSQERQHNSNIGVQGNIVNSSVGQVIAVENLTIEKNARLQNLVRRTKAVLSNFCPHGFVETRALELIRETPAVGPTTGDRRPAYSSKPLFVKGSLGDGKTTLCLRILKECEEDDYIPLILSEPEEWDLIPAVQTQGNNDGDDDSEMDYQSERFVVFIDNIFGPFEINQAKREKWEEKFPMMLTHIQCGQVKLVMASRSAIFARCQAGLGEQELFQMTRVVDLQDEKFSLTTDNKVNILAKFLEFHKVQITIGYLDLVSAAQGWRGIGFPQSCRYFAESKDAQKMGEKFFENPVQFLKQRIQLMKERNTEMYFVLALIFLQNGAFYQKFLTERSNQPEIKEIRNLCGVSRNVSSGEIREIAQSLKGMYVTYNETEDCYSFSHQSVWDALCVFICQADLNRALEACTAQQVVEYIRIRATESEGEQFAFIVPESQWPLLAFRLLTEMTSGATAIACSHSAWSDKKFVDKLMQEHENDVDTFCDILKHTITSVTVDRAQLSASNPESSWEIRISHRYVRMFEYHFSICALIQNHHSYFTKLILRDKAFKMLPNGDQVGEMKKALTCACYYADPDLVEFFLERKVEASTETIWAACLAQQENLNIITKVLESLPFTALPREEAITLLKLVLQEDRGATLFRLLPEVQAFTDIKSALDQILSQYFLLSYRDAINNGSLSQKDMETFRHSDHYKELTKAGASFPVDVLTMLAIRFNDPIASKDLLADDDILHSMYDNSITHIHKAVCLGSDSFIKELLLAVERIGKKLDMNEGNKFGETALHLAAGYGKPQILETLLKYGASSDSKTRWGYTPLHSAAVDKRSGQPDSDDYCHMVEHLICATPDVNVANEDGDTPLHIAIRKHRTAFVMLLLKSNSVDVNCQNRAGDTPLHFTNLKPSDPMVQLLLSAGAQTDIANKEGIICSIKQ